MTAIPQPAIPEETTHQHQVVCSTAFVHKCAHFHAYLPQVPVALGELGKWNWREAALKNLQKQRLMSL